MLPYFFLAVLTLLNRLGIASLKFFMVNGFKIGNSWMFLLFSAGLADKLNIMRKSLGESEERFRSIFEDSADAVMLLDENGFIDCNNSALRMFGFSDKGEFVGLHPSDISPDVQPGGETTFKAADRRIREAIENGSAKFEWIHKRKAGDNFYAQVMLTAFDFSGKKLLHAVVRDITDMKTAEKALRESEEKFRSLVNTAASVILLLSPECKILEFNPEAERLYGMKRGDVLGKDYLELFIPADIRGAVAADINKVMGGEPTRGFENEIISFNGKNRLLSWNVSRLLNEDGSPLGVISVGHDITENKKAEKELLYEKQFSDLIINTMPGVFYVYQIVGEGARLVKWNENQIRVTGYGSDETLGKTPLDFFNRGYHEIIKSAISRVMTKGDVLVEAPILTKDGKEIPYIFSAVKFKRDSEDFFLGIGIDITEKKLFEEALRLSEEKFSRAFMASPNVMVITSPADSRIVEVNERFVSTSGYTREEAIGRTVGELNIFVNPDELERLTGLLRNERRIRNQDILFRTKSGEVRLGSLSAEIVEIEGSEHVINMIEDITEARTLERELMNISEMERQRIGSDLHDDLGQSLTGSTFLIQSLKQDLEKIKYPDIPRIDKIGSLVRESLAKIRSISKMLSPVEMNERGLVSALEDMADNIRNVYGITCEIFQEGDFFVRDSQVSVNLYYIAREAVNNALRHGKAKVIEIHLMDKESELEMTIEDNGCGVTGKEKGKGMGLRIMRYRSNIIGADVYTGNNTGGGFTVRVHCYK